MNEKNDSFQDLNSSAQNPTFAKNEGGIPPQLDAASFEHFITEYSSILYSFARTLTRDQTVAEDAVQESFIELWRNRAKLELGESGLKKWLILVVRNKCKDLYRSERYRRENLILQMQTDDHPSDSESLGKMDALDAVRAAISHLSEQERDIITLHYFQAIPIAKIAEHFSIPVGTVRSRLCRSRSRIATILQLSATLQEANTSGETPIFWEEEANRLQKINFVNSEFDEFDPRANEGSGEKLPQETAIERSKAAYRADLPDLLITNPRRWVAYADGKQVKIGNSQRELYRHCLEELKLTHDRFVVRQIIPEESPEIEIIER